MACPPRDGELSALGSRRTRIVQNGAMLVERIEGKWIEAFKDVFRLCAACHFDYPMRGCTVELDGFKVVDAGRLAQI